MGVQTDVGRQHVGSYTPLRVVGVSSAATIVVLAIGGMHAIVDGFRLGHWMQAHQQFSYEHEFVRRGLIGEVLRQVSFPNEPRPMYVLSVAVYGGIAAMLAWLAWSALVFLPRTLRLAGTVLALALPFSLPHHAFDLGRSDSFLYLLALPLVVRRRSPLLAYAAVGVAGVLIHEIFLVVQLPLVVAARPLDEWRDTFRDRRIIVVLLGALVALVAVVAEGNMESMTMPEFRAELQEKVPGYDETVIGSPHTLLFNTPGSEVRRAVEHMNGWALANSVVAAAPGLALLWFHRRVRSDHRDRFRIAVAVVPTAALFLMGFDFPRWIALASFNLLVIVLLLFRDDPPVLAGTVVESAPEGDARPASWRLPERLRAPALLLAATVVAGPIGVVSAYPMWTEIMDKLTSGL